MNQQEYLSQISGTVRPVKQPKQGGKNFLSSPIAKALLFGVAALIVIIIMGSILGGNKKSPKDSLINLMLHIDGTSEQITEYQAYIRDSSLRANGASLNTVLADASKAVNDYLVAKYSFKSGSESKSAQAKADENAAALGDELFEARINGWLDTVFARKMAYEITLIKTEIDSAYNMVKDDSFKSSLSSSYNSLTNLYDLFDSFSENN